MEFDQLIDPPSFAQDQNKVAMVKFWKIYLTFVGVVLIGIGVMLATVDLGGSTDLTVLGFGLLFTGGLLVLLALRSGKASQKRKAELDAKINAYYTGERARLAKVKETMSAAEWENYKLQLQNQKLLKELNTKQAAGRKTTTTTWTFESGD